MDINSVDKELVLTKALSSDKYLQALDEVLKNESDGYAILSYKEWKTCLTYKNGLWQVSFIERGEEMQPKTFNDVNDACLYLIDEVSPKRKLKRIRNRYLSKVGDRANVIDLKSRFSFGMGKSALAMIQPSALKETDKQRQS